MPVLQRRQTGHVLALEVVALGAELGEGSVEIAVIPGSSPPGEAAAVTDHDQSRRYFLYLNYSHP
ncbi:hypothetical protein OHA59_47975 [Streptomyces sp. NBC_01589]